MKWNWDLATILVILIVISLIILLYDAIWLASKRQAAKNNLSNNLSDTDQKNATRLPFLVDLSRSLLPVFIIVLILRSFLVEPFRIPSQSMMPTLLVGDFILVNKFSYGLRLPIINQKIWAIGAPERGDVIVFRYPEDLTTPFIKRVVALPGDKVEYHAVNKTLYINGEPVSQEVVGTYQGVGAGSNMTGSQQRIEFLDSAEHDILVWPRQSAYMPITQMTVPEAHYFVLGDNRDSSRDSRYWGTVPEENLIGKAFLIWMNWDWSNGGVSWRRLGNAIE